MKSERGIPRLLEPLPPLALSDPAGVGYYVLSSDKLIKKEIYTTDNLEIAELARLNAELKIALADLERLKLEIDALQKELVAMTALKQRYMMLMYRYWRLWGVCK